MRATFSRPLRRLSRLPLWAKALSAMVLLGGVVWVSVLGVQYLNTRRPLTELAAFAPLASARENPPHLVRSVYGVGRPLGVAAGPDGTFYVTESGGQRLVHAFDAAGESTLAFAPSPIEPATRGEGSALDSPATTIGARIPVYIAMSPAGDLFVSDRAANAIFVFSKTGTFLGTVPSPLPGGEPWRPLGLTFDAKGNLYVTEVTPGKHRVLVLEPADGLQFNLKLAFGSEGSEPGQFWFPNGVAIDAQGRIYVSDGNNGRVQIFDGTGSAVGAIGRGLGNGDLALPRGIAVDDSDRLFVVDTSLQAVQVYDVSNGAPKFLYTFGAGGAEDALQYPNGLALDGQGNIYVTDRENNRVQVWGR